MKKETFMNKLKKHLKMLPEDEIYEILDYYREYIEESEDEEAFLEQLPPPKEIAKRLKNELKYSDSSDHVVLSFKEDHPMEMDFPLNNAQVTSAKKQMKFLACFCVAATAIYDLANAINPNLFVDPMTGAGKFPLVIAWLLIFATFVLCHSLAYKNDMFLPLKQKYQLFFILKLLAPQFLVIFILLSTHLPYSFSPVMQLLHSLPMETIGQTFVALQLWNYLTLHFPVYLYFILAIFAVLPLNFLTSMGND